MNIKSNIKINKSLTFNYNSKLILIYYNNDSFFLKITVCSVTLKVQINIKKEILDIQLEFSLTIISVHNDMEGKSKLKA